MWDKKTIQKHLQAAKLLDQIKNSAFEFIASKPGVTEHQVHQFILREYKKHGLINDDNKTIVAFNQSTDAPHYYPTRAKSKKLRPNTLIMIDIWARLNKKGAPYADITWMGFYGGKNDSRKAKVPADISKAVQATFAGRDNAVKFLKAQLAKKHMPTGRQVELAGYAPIAKARLDNGIMHTLGHSIGFDSPHGKQEGLHYYAQKNLNKNLAYTIEPGIYFPGKFGIRTEIDFYIDPNYELVITTPLQKKLVML